MYCISLHCIAAHCTVLCIFHSWVTTHTTLGDGKPNKPSTSACESSTPRCLAFQCLGWTYTAIHDFHVIHKQLLSASELQPRGSFALYEQGSLHSLDKSSLLDRNKQQAVTELGSIKANIPQQCMMLQGWQHAVCHSLNAALGLPDGFWLREEPPRNRIWVLKVFLVCKQTRSKCSMRSAFMGLEHLIVICRSSHSYEMFKPNKGCVHAALGRCWFAYQKQHNNHCRPQHELSLWHAPSSCDINALWAARQEREGARFGGGGGGGR